MGPGFIMVEAEDAVIDKTTMVPETDHIVEISIKIAVEEGEITVTVVAIEIIGPIIEITVGPEIGTVTEMAIGTAIDQTTEGTIVIKGMVIEVKIAVDLGTETGVAPGNRYKSRRQSRDDTRNRDRSQSRSRSSSHVSTNRDRGRYYRCNEYDEFARECPNNTLGRNTNNAKDSLLSITDTDQAYTLDYTDGEDFDMDLNM